MGRQGNVGDWKEEQSPPQTLVERPQGTSVSKPFAEPPVGRRWRNRSMGAGVRRHGFSVPTFSGGEKAQVGALPCSLWDTGLIILKKES